MRWMWIDRIVELVPGERLVATKSVSLSEEHLHDHFPADPDTGESAMPLMPACFIVEGMAQTGGILVGHAGKFKEKVILAKVARVEIERDATPGSVLRYTATLERFDQTGASTSGTVELMTPRAGDDPWEIAEIGRIDLMFAHLDRNMAGAEFPEENFVFSDSFRTLLTSSGIEAEF